MSSASANPPGERAKTRAPTASERFFDVGFRWATFGLAWLSVGVLLLVLSEIGLNAIPAMQKHGTDLVTNTNWDNNAREYGLGTYIFGTIYSSAIALILASLLGLAVAIFITEDFLPPKMRTVLKNIIELLAAIPSVIYGLWGLAVIVPLVEGFVGMLPEDLRADATRQNMLSASIVLGFMILPTITALARDAIASVPPRLKEGAIGLGATRWETILKITLPTAWPGIVGAIMLAYGRALGETMALAMLVGGGKLLTWDILQPGNTLAALLANNFGEARSDPPQVAALMYAAMILMVITLVVNLLGSLVIYRASSKLKGLR